ncbi:MAG: hypothetical protein PHG19_02535 [Anaerotignum sp.]|nr:hypothetical protein [Anaerotignum sp.]
MKFNTQKLTTICSILGFILLTATQIQTLVYQDKYEELTSRSSSKSQPSRYDPEEEAEDFKPESWDSMYLPSSLPLSYHLSMASSSDTYISCRFSQDDDLLALRYPPIYFTQWHSIKEVTPIENSKLPPILKTGKVQFAGYEDDTEEQLEVNINATLEPQTYNDKEYYFCDDTPDGDLLLLWYDEENTFALRVKIEAGPETKAKVDFTLDDMFAIADSVENYS